MIYLSISDGKQLRDVFNYETVCLIFKLLIMAILLKPNFARLINFNNTRIHYSFFIVHAIS